MTLNLRRDVSSALVADGFVRGKRVHVKRVDADWSLLVDTGTVFKGEIGQSKDIAPGVGIRHEGVEQLLQQLCSLPASADSGTVWANAGYIVDGKYRAWLPPFAPGMPPVTVDEVLAVIRAALTQLSGYLALERVPAAWEDIRETQSDPACAYRRVVVQLLLRDTAGVQRELSRAEHHYCIRDDEIAADFRAFRDRVFALAAK
jgi:hypothetical protein